jgi:hypothetical protein
METKGKSTRDNCTNIRQRRNITWLESFKIGLGATFCRPKTRKIRRGGRCQPQNRSRCVWISPDLVSDKLGCADNADPRNTSLASSSIIGATNRISGTAAGVDRTRRKMMGSWMYGRPRFFPLYLLVLLFFCSSLRTASSLRRVATELTTVAHCRTEVGSSQSC